MSRLITLKGSKLSGRRPRDISDYHKVLVQDDSAQASLGMQALIHLQSHLRTLRHKKTIEKLDPFIILDCIDTRNLSELVKVLQEAKSLPPITEFLNKIAVNLTQPMTPNARITHLRMFWELINHVPTAKLTAKLPKSLRWLHTLIRVALARHEWLKAAFTASVEHMQNAYLSLAESIRDLNELPATLIGEDEKSWIDSVTTLGPNLYRDRFGQTALHYVVFGTLSNGGERRLMPREQSRSLPSAKVHDRDVQASIHYLTTDMALYPLIDESVIGFSPLALVLARLHQTFYPQYLCNMRDALNVPLFSELWLDSVTVGDLKTIRVLLTRAPEYLDRCQDENGNSLLQVAVLNQQTRVVKALLPHTHCNRLIVRNDAGKNVFDLAGELPNSPASQAIKQALQARRIEITLKILCAYEQRRKNQRRGKESLFTLRNAWELQPLWWLLRAGPHMPLLSDFDLSAEFLTKLSETLMEAFLETLFPEYESSIVHTFNCAYVCLLSSRLLSVIGRGIRHGTLRALDLRGCGITDAAIKPLLSALQQSTSVPAVIDLRGNDLSPHTKTLIQQRMRTQQYYLIDANATMQRWALSSVAEDDHVVDAMMTDLLNYCCALFGEFPYKPAHQKYVLTNPIQCEFAVLDAMRTYIESDLTAQAWTLESAQRVLSHLTHDIEDILLRPDVKPHHLSVRPLIQAIYHRVRTTDIGLQQAIWLKAIVTGSTMITIKHETLFPQLFKFVKYFLSRIDQFSEYALNLVMDTQVYQQSALIRRQNPYCLQNRSSSNFSAFWQTESQFQLHNKPPEIIRTHQARLAHLRQPLKSAQKLISSGTFDSKRSAAVFRRLAISIALRYSLVLDFLDPISCIKVAGLIAEHVLQYLIVEAHIMNAADIQATVNTLMQWVIHAPIIRSVSLQTRLEDAFSELGSLHETITVSEEELNLLRSQFRLQLCVDDDVIDTLEQSQSKHRRDAGTEEPRLDVNSDATDDTNHIVRGGQALVSPPSIGTLLRQFIITNREAGTTSQLYQVSSDENARPLRYVQQFQ